MMFSRLAILVLLLAPVAVVQADDVEPAKILVTFSDPGMSNAARSGPSRPGYSRRSSHYLVSVNVRRAASRLAKEFQLEIVDEWPIIALRVHCLVYAIPDGTMLESLLERLRARPEVESAQPMNTFVVSGAASGDGTEPFAGLQHNLEALELTTAHTWSEGKGADVTIIDTGADLAHPELVTQIRHFLNFVDRDESKPVAEAHGTAIAGVIGAASHNGIGITGVAPAADITVLRACWHANGGSRAACNSFTLAKALSYALDSGTDIINLSIGGPSDALLGRLVTLAQQRGVIVIAARPPDDRVGFPGDVPGVIVVSSWPAADSALNGSALFAPGEEILVPVPGGGFDYASGSSLSAAQVSGVVALLVAERPKLAIDEINRLLTASRTTLGASVNACRALAQLLQRSGCREEAAAKIAPEPY